MRNRITAMAVSVAVITAPAAAQFTEESVEVPLSPESRAAGPGEPSDEAWRETAAAYDVERIESDAAAYAGALEIARSAEAEKQRTLLLEILQTLPRPIDTEALPGPWQCRTVRFTAEPAALKIYGWWDCQITELSDGLLLEKLTGSELSSGFLYPESEIRMIYLGHRHGAREPARPYDGEDGPAGDDPANPDDPGILTQRGPDRLILAKPRPTIEDSDYDILELRRPGSGDPAQ